MSADSDATPLAIVFLDGLSARRRPARAEVDGGQLVLIGEDGPLASWPRADIRRLEAPDGLLRLGLADAAQLARIEADDPAVQSRLAALCPGLDRSMRDERRAVPRIILWSLAAALSLVLTAVLLVPLVADRLAPLVPLSWERRLGAAVDNQVRAVFSGKVCGAPAGKAALALLMGRIEAAAGLGRPLKVEVLSNSIPNAFALPGDRIYLMEGLLAKARNPDEIAGVIAHEIGHAAHRDALRRLLQSGGTSFLLGLLFGDVTGSGIVILLGRQILDSSYSRDAETAADAYAGRIMAGLGRPAAPMAELLVRLTGEEDRRYGLLRSHPFSQDRLSRLRSASPRQDGAPLLSDDQWQALRGICSSQG